MKKTKFDSLQYVFACISTHSKWAEIIKEDISSLFKEFCITSKDKEILRKFFIQHGQAMLNTAILFEEKRWREVLPALKYTLAILSVEKLNQYWKRYANSFDIKKAIPRSPLLESIEFLKYLIQAESHPLIRNIFEYEVSKNLVSIYDFKSTKSSYLIDIPVGQEELKSYQAKINPSFISKNFLFPISKIVTDLNRKVDVDRHKINLKEFIGFYKKTNSDTVKVIQFNYSTHNLLTNLVNSSNLAEWVESTVNSTKTSQKNCLSFLAKMQRSGVISINKNQ